MNEDHRKYESRYKKPTKRNVERFFTSDGKGHESELDAHNHERVLNLRRFLDRYGYNGMEKDDAANIMAENAEELKGLL